MQEVFLGRKSFAADKVDEIRIEWDAGHVQLVMGEEQGVILTESSEDGGAPPMHVSLSEGALYVRACKDARAYGLAKSLVVAFPLGKRFRAVRVHTSFASVSARELKADVCTLDSISGSIFADEIEASQLIGKSVSGSIRMEDACVHTLRLTTVNGAIDYAVLYNAALTVEQLSADSVGGNVSFAFPAKSSFALRYHTAGGQFFDAFGAAYADGAYVAGAGSASVRVRTVTGSLTVEKRG